LNGGFFGRYIPASGSSGQLVYVHEGTLFGVPFDSARLELKGAPAPILGDVAADPSTGAGQFDYSANGGFIYQNGKPVSQTYPIMWFENSGAARALLAKPAFYISPRFSPDGGSLAFRIAIASGSAKGDIYVYDWRREIFTRLTFGNRQDFSPTWTPDGKHIVFRSPSPSGGSYIEWIRSDGAGETERLLDTRGLANAYSFSPDGRRVAYYEQTAETGSDLWTLPLDLSDPEHPKPGRPEPFLRTPANESFPTFSPDGRWIAYNSDETGVREVYVRPFPGPGGKWQISTGGGLFPIWARNGRDLFFETLDNHIMMVDYSASGDSFSNEKPHLWSDRQIRDMGTVFNYDLTPDGKRIVAFPPDTASIAESGSVKVSFLLNFLDELRRRVPTGK
jgi:serine/threonine-protein kinase